MTTTPAVGVIGGYGAVGGAVVRRLHRAGVGPLLVAGRDPRRAENLLASLDGGPEPRTAAVDLADPASLDRFAARCRLVVNCAGPSYRVLDTVAVAAARHGAHYVDAARAARPARLDAYLGGIAPLTPAAAGDVLLARGPAHGVPGACWHDGRPRERSLEPRRAVRLAAFPRPVDAFPFLSTEAVRLARATGIGRVHWYTAFGGDRLAEELAMAWALGEGGTEGLVAAADADVRRHGAWYGQEFQLWDGTADGPPAATLVLRAEDSYELSGFLTALAVRRTLEGAVPPGVRFAAEVLDPADTVRLLAADPVAELDIR